MNSRQVIFELTEWRRRWTSKQVATLGEESTHHYSPMSLDERLRTRRSIDSFCG